MAPLQTLRKHVTGRIESRQTLTPEKLERKARKLWNLRLIDPCAPQYALAGKLWEEAQQIRKNTIQNPS